MKSAKKRVVPILLTMMIGLMVGTIAQAEGEENSDVVSGPYIRGGVSFAFPNIDGADLDTQYGFTAAGGYQFAPAFASDVEVAWTGGGDVPGLSASSFVVLVNGRLYPLALFGGAGDFFIKPYGLAGIGAGWAKIHSVGTSNASFVYNLGGGVDVMLGDTLGIYGEVSYKGYTSDSTTLNGLSGNTSLNLGGVIKF